MMRPQENSVESKARKATNRGFSLIELLVVVAVILVLAGISIPNFIRAKMAANESSAVQGLRTITTAQVSYSTTYGVAYGIGYAPTLADLGGTSSIPTASGADLIDTVLSAGSKAGYVYTLTPLTYDTVGNVITYSVNADPQVPGSTGQRHFYTDQTGVIRANDNATAGSSDNPV
jgi:type IV pilus assembly protein PilA